MTKTEAKLGYWAAILSAIFSVAWFITFCLQDVFQAVPDWHNLTAYANTFSVVRLTYLYPSLLLAITYLVMLACIHRVASPERRVFSLIGLAIGILYSGMASINYNIQVVAVRLSLAAEEISGIEMFIPDNPNSIFRALANSYVYMSISMIFLGFAFSHRKEERWIKGILVAQVVTALGQIGDTMFGLNENIFIVTSMVWVIGSPIAFILIARWFGSHVTTAAVSNPSDDVTASARH